MSVFITLFLIYIFIVMGLSMTESLVKSLLHRPSSRKHIRLKRPIFGKKQ